MSPGCCTRGWGAWQWSKGAPHPLTSPPLFTFYVEALASLPVLEVGSSDGVGCTWQKQGAAGKVRGGGVLERVKSYHLLYFAAKNWCLSGHLTHINGKKGDDIFPHSCEMQVTALAPCTAIVQNWQVTPWRTITVWSLVFVSSFLCYSLFICL